MSLFGRIIDRILVGRFKDKTRHRLCTHLRTIGLNVQVSERGLHEEGISGGLIGTSLGLLEVHESPIQWINMLEHPASRYASTTFTNVYVVPDHRVRSGGYLELRSTRQRNASVYGRVIDLYWTANFVGTRVIAAPNEEWDEDMEENLLDRLNNDTPLKESLIRLNEDIMVRSVPNFWCWAISSGSYQESGLGQESRRTAPSREQWECYEMIARHLLESGQERQGLEDAEVEKETEPEPSEDENQPDSESTDHSD
ncbi:MAG: hypothetical protein JSV77_04490 [Dehalococcoidales bacterium]|nr:MAG: hypothetical protein JSV77_04490 [Dehalococcoidales bacterium]